MTLEAYLGVPYVLGGATRAGADCGGLVVLAYRELRGIELPPYNAELSGMRRPPAGAAREFAEIEAARAWAEVSRAEARAFDVVQLSARADRDHFGIVMDDPRWLLTTDAGANAHRTRWGRGSPWEGEGKIRGIWRYAG